MKSKYLSFLIFMMIASGCTIKNQTLEVKVADFGAVPDDGKEDKEAILAAIKACPRDLGAVLVFAKGVYHVRGFESDSGNHPPAFLIDGYNNLIIEGNGAEFLGSNLITFFDFRNCTNSTIKNLTIDTDPVPFSAGKVIAVGDKEAVQDDGEMIPSLPYTAAGDREFDVEVLPPHTARSGLTTEAVLGYDPANKRLAYRGIDLYQYDFPKTTELIRPGVMRVFVEGGTPELGTYVNLRHECYGYDAFLFNNCDGVTLENINIYSSAGNGLVASNSSDLLLRNYNVMIKPGSGRWMSTNADATHFSNCRGYITLEDCVFEGVGDDATNVHGSYVVVAERINRRVVSLQRGSGRMPWVPKIGDQLEIGGGDNPLVPYATAIVSSVKKDTEAKVVIVQFSEDLPERTGQGDIVGNASACPVVCIRRCTVRNNRARGFLIKTRDAIIEDCKFEYISGPAILIRTDASDWWESISTRDIVIRNNEMVGCNFGAARRKGIIVIVARAKSGAALEDVHKNITIENNIIKYADGSPIQLASADSVIIRGNRFQQPSDAAILIDYCSNVEIIDNMMINGREGVKIGPGIDPATIKIENNVGF